MPRSLHLKRLKRLFALFLIIVTCGSPLFHFNEIANIQLKHASTRSLLLKFSRPQKCLRKCANKENLISKDSKFRLCSFTEGKFSKTWNASTSTDFYSCLSAIRQLNQDVNAFIPSLWNIHKKYWLKEKGIVFSLKISNIKLVFSTIHVIREHLYSKLPVEVFVSKNELRECRSTLASFLQVSCRVPQFNSIIRPPRSRFGWKSVSILQSSFKNVLWLDADCVPLVDPDELLESEHFKAKGAVFWPDLTGVQCDPSETSMWPSGSSEGALWNVFNVKFQANEWKHVQEFESGQILVDTERYFGALHLVFFLTEHGIFQQFAYGDKEAFRWSWLSLNANFYFSEYPALVSYYRKFDQVSKQCYRMHYFNEKPAFIHGKKQSRKTAKCGYDYSSSHALVTTGIPRGTSVCSEGICLNKKSFFCPGNTFSFEQHSKIVNNFVQDVEEAWERVYTQYSER
mmetsp:Transcript_6773/g.20263  ORF Transcript_6773/g.20263 Transcript_6773/m.20263 type:complete len:456 (+) Transcript_6773:167-1534(+)